MKSTTSFLLVSIAVVIFGFGCPTLSQARNITPANWVPGDPITRDIFKTFEDMKFVELNWAASVSVHTSACGPSAGGGGLGRMGNLTFSGCRSSRNCEGQRGGMKGGAMAFAPDKNYTGLNLTIKFALENQWTNTSAIAILTSIPYTNRTFLDNETDTVKYNLPFPSDKKFKSGKYQLEFKLTALNDSNEMVICRVLGLSYYSSAASTILFFSSLLFQQIFLLISK